MRARAVRPYALMLTWGNVADVKAAPELLARLGRTRYLLADKGYRADALRQASAVPVAAAASAIRHDKQRYRDRHLIENAFWSLKECCRVASRYDKLGANFLSSVALASAIVFWL